MTLGTRAEFVSEPIEPVEESFDTAAMATGAPGLPSRFKWRGTEYEVARVVETWKTAGPCRNGADERYVRRHNFRILTTDGCEMEIYFDRQVRRGQNAKKRWWLATVAQQTVPERPEKLRNARKDANKGMPV